MLESKEICELVTVEDDRDFRDFVATNPTGLRMVPEIYREASQVSMKAEAGAFAKWIRTQDSKINVELDDKIHRLVLRSGDVWLPLVFLSSDIALPIYLNLVSSFIWDKMKGALKGDTVRVHLSAEYEDKVSGTVKRFNFEGDADSLQKAIKRFDLNRFLDE
jgi:hypothetical protein